MKFLLYMLAAYLVHEGGHLANSPSAFLSWQGNSPVILTEKKDATPAFFAGGFATEDKLCEIEDFKSAVALHTGLYGIRHIIGWRPYNSDFNNLPKEAPYLAIAYAFGTYYSKGKSWRPVVNIAENDGAMIGIQFKW